MSDARSTRELALAAVTEWLDGKDEGSLALLERGERVYYADTIERRHPTRGVESTKVLLRVPMGPELVEARLRALSHVIDLVKRFRKDADPKTVDDVTAYVGPGYWDECENVFILAASLFREPDGAGEPTPYMLPALLWQAHDRTALATVAAKLDHYSRLESPRLAELDEATFLHVLSKVAERRSLSPLAYIAPAARDGFVLTAALRLAHSLTARPSPLPLSTSPAAD